MFSKTFIGTARSLSLRCTGIYILFHTFKCVVLSRKGAGFIGLKGNSKQNLSFYKETYVNSAILYRPVKDFSHSFIVLTSFVLLSWFQNKACVTLDRFFLLALMYVAVWSSHAVINFIGNYFETHFCQVFICKKFSKIGYLVFCYRMRASFNLMYPETV